MIFNSEGIHQGLYIVTKHKVIFLSGGGKKKAPIADDCETKKFREIFSRRFHCLSPDPSNSALLLEKLQIADKIVQFVLCETVWLWRRKPTVGDMWFSRRVVQ